MMFRKGLVCLSALYATACAPCLAADAPMRTAPPACAPSVDGGHSSGRRGAGWRRDYSWAAGRSASGAHVWSGAGAGVAFGLTPGVGQLGASGFGYYGVNGCWSYQPVYDRFGNYFGQQPVNICLDPPPN
jgi:hypothetical protein